ncbi:MAG TPA: XrtA system polysaccharide chain length determinant [Terriglobales bacterium]|nr:XrtA system polysaccharide chain length determinant [Terriglobales bacterium]
MAEDFQEQGAGEFNLQHWLGVARRRHLQFLVPFFIGWLAVWTASWILPPRYKSSTLILVEQPTMPKDYVTPNVNDDLQERVQSITQQILSRTRLLHIIEQLNLYPATPGTNVDGRIEEMRKDIEIELVRDASQQRVTAFNIHYSSRDPNIAQQVTSELTNLFISENNEVRQQQSEGTTKFLEDQVETARKSLSEQEEKIREYKGQHVGELPTQLGSNLQILSGLQSQLQAENDALNTAKQQHVYLQTLLSQYRTMEVSTTTKGSDSAPLGLPAIDQELDKLRNQLADLSSRYTDQHPDVRKLKDQIAKTEKMRAQLMADLKAKAEANAQSDDTSAVTRNGVDNAQSAPMAQLQGQLRSNEIEIQNRERSIESLQAKIGEYQARLNDEPVREQQLADLTRGYDQSKANYDDLLKKKNESAMATSMELLQQGEHFRMIDPPSLPLKPDFPNRLKFCGIGLGVGLALGVVVAGAFEMMDHRLFDEKQIASLLPVAVLAEIPDVISSQDEQRQRKHLWLTWAATGAVCVVILAGSAISYLRG